MCKFFLYKRWICVKTSRVAYIESNGALVFHSKMSFAKGFYTNGSAVFKSLDITNNDDIMTAVVIKSFRNT